MRPTRAIWQSNSNTSSPKCLMRLRGVGYLGAQRKRVVPASEILNLLGSRNHDIDYFYTSRLQGEAAGGVDDVRFHPVEPLGIRG